MATQQVISKKEAGTLVMRLRKYTRGWNPPRLAEELNRVSDEVWTRSKVYHLENGDRDFTSDVMGALGAVFDVPPDLFLYGGEFEASTTTTIRSRGTVIKLNRPNPGYPRPDVVSALAG